MAISVFYHYIATVVLYKLVLFCSFCLLLRLKLGVFLWLLVSFAVF